MLLDRDIDNGDGEQEECDDDGNVVLPDSLHELSNWKMNDQIRAALHFNENLDIPKKFQRRAGNLMNTGENMIAAAKRRKQLEKMFLLKKQTKRGSSKMVWVFNKNTTCTQLHDSMENISRKDI